ncbi:unnamed protein product [Thelazia callipaeda]|uniref:Prefoldin subunit 2 n=1 Tax=Thelazia callipaeda TaxID=103827 RepID=A0A0N5DBB5_THECL|nr:unnamed protein product [Thelazia callipaeda]
MPLSITPAIKENNESPLKFLKERQEAKESGRNAIIAGLQELREQQKNVIMELTKLEDDRREHARVIEVLRKMETDRKCYRMVGTTLVQHQIGTVIPILEATLSNLNNLTRSMKDSLMEKGKELEQYTEKHNIHFVSEKELSKHSQISIPKK